jgi:outer membrane protease
MTGLRTGWSVAVLVTLGMALAAPSTEIWASDTEPARPRAEVSIRSWLFTNGETQWSHDASGLDPRLGNPTSKLTYKDNNSHIIELSGKFNVDKRWFVRGDVGFSVAFHRGTLTDDDFTSVGGQHLFSETTSDITGSGTQYVNADVGYRLLDYPGHRGNLDVFVGYQYWRTKYEASGITQVVCTPSGIPGIACNPAGTVSNQGQVVISNTTQWNSLRVGVQTEYRLTRRFSVEGKLAFIPISYLQNDDIHHLRSDLQQDPSFYMSGYGIGADVEAGARYMIYRGWFLNAGYRFWWNRVVLDGNWKVYPVGASSASAPLTEFQTMRYGVTLGLSHTF